jgi:hypothetical protein
MHHGAKEGPEMELEKMDSRALIRHSHWFEKERERRRFYAPPPPIPLWNRHSREPRRFYASPPPILPWNRHAHDELYMQIFACT